MSRLAFALAEAMVDEGVGTALDQIGEHLGLDGVAVTAAYHQGRYMLPRGRHKVVFLDGDRAFFRPEPSLYGHAPVPAASAANGEGDLLEAVCEAAAARGMLVDAWTVFLHNASLGAAHPDLVARNAFGDAYLTDLCPANPRVRAYARGLAADVAGRPVRAVVGESLHHHGFGHGYHHELTVRGLSPLALLLFGLCFCPHCRRGAEAVGVDAERCRLAVRDHLAAALENPAPARAEEPSPEEVGALAGGELAGYLAARSRSVASLAAEVAASVHERGARLVWIDPCGSAAGYATGAPAGPLAADSGWRHGIDLAAISRHADAVLYTAYVRDLSRLEAELGAYQRALGAGDPRGPGAEGPGSPGAADPGGPARLAVALRPGLPDHASASELRAALELAEAATAGDLYFYAYGPLRTFELERLREVST